MVYESSAPARKLFENSSKMPVNMWSGGKYCSCSVGGVIVNASAVRYVAMAPIPKTKNNEAGLKNLKLFTGAHVSIGANQS